MEWTMGWSCVGREEKFVQRRILFFIFIFWKNEEATVSIVRTVQRLQKMKTRPYIEKKKKKKKKKRNSTCNLAYWKQFNHIVV
ncbi:hypothetical protein T4D_15074 [Trichinella pseudospiralis]|uniref:Uncharacterized protein n=1 Tax=Trichinella pseudospiralis TaxID=6337 RepID=A0A0V1FA58_TRIPS|nr:hypothetical protein T4D_15074 [Trichinella pseudospiralis]